MRRAGSNEAEMNSMRNDWNQKAGALGKASVRFRKFLGVMRLHLLDGLPDHVRFLLRHALIGFAIGLAAVVFIVWQDVGRVGTLIASSSQRWLALGLLCFMFGLTFGSVQMGFAIMLLPGPADEDDL